MTNNTTPPPQPQALAWTKCNPRWHQARHGPLVLDVYCASDDPDAPHWWWEISPRPHAGAAWKASPTTSYDRAAAMAAAEKEARRVAQWYREPATAAGKGAKKR